MASNNNSDVSDEKLKNYFKIHEEFFNGSIIDISGMSSRQRIQLIKDQTRICCLIQKLMELTNQPEQPYPTLNLKLDKIKFSLDLDPTPRQPGNGWLKMGSKYCGTYKAMEKYDCFDKLNGNQIDEIITKARKSGKEITAKDIQQATQQQQHQHAEALNYFMVLYDFEVARRLQRPFTTTSEELDSLPIALGIALMHRINRKTENGEKWVFFSDLFTNDYENRKTTLQTIIGEYKRRMKVDELDENVIGELISEQFGEADMLPLLQNLQINKLDNSQ